MAPIPVMATVNPTASADNKTLPPTLLGLVVFLSPKNRKHKKGMHFRACLFYVFSAAAHRYNNGSKSPDSSIPAVHNSLHPVGSYQRHGHSHRS